MEFGFQYHDPWEYILNLIHNKSLASVSCWNSVQKIYCCSQEDLEECIINEPNTANTWWEVDVSSSQSERELTKELIVSFQSSLPNNGPYPHCYLPLHFWLNKGLVTQWVKKYPMILCAAWLPRNIQNASDNGGGILLGYMPIVSGSKH